jgi:tripartite-type tricarboxylate transporter receptor subunit TctC
VVFGSISSSLSYVRANRLVALAVTVRGARRSRRKCRRSPRADVGDIDVPSWYTLLLPARTPGDIAERLRGELKRLVANPEFAGQACAAGVRGAGARAGPIQRVSQIGNR